MLFPLKYSLLIRLNFLPLVVPSLGNYLQEYHLHLQQEYEELPTQEPSIIHPGVSSQQKSQEINSYPFVFVIAFAKDTEELNLPTYGVTVNLMVFKSFFSFAFN